MQTTLTVYRLPYIRHQTMCYSGYFQARNDISWIWCKIVLSLCLYMVGTVLASKATTNKKKDKRRRSTFKEEQNTKEEEENEEEEEEKEEEEEEQQQQKEEKEEKEK